jgi:hypothetical protein
VFCPRFRDEAVLSTPSPTEIKGARSLRVAVVFVVLIAIFSFLAVAFVILIVVILVWLLAKEDMGSYRLIERV